MRVILAVLAVTGIFAVAAFAESWQAWDRSALNTFRHHHHRHPLAYSAILQRRAQAWANYAARHDYFDDDPFAAWVCDHELPARYGSGGNIAVGGSVRVDQVALQHSPPHRRNLLDARFRWVGVGAAYGFGRVWLVQDFCG